MIMLGNIGVFGVIPSVSGAEIETKDFLFDIRGEPKNQSAPPPIYVKDGQLNFGGFRAGDNLGEIFTEAFSGLSPTSLATIGTNNNFELTQGNVDQVQLLSLQSSESINWNITRLYAGYLNPAEYVFETIVGVLSGELNIFFANDTTELVSLVFNSNTTHTNCSWVQNGGYPGTDIFQNDIQATYFYVKANLFTNASILSVEIRPLSDFSTAHSNLFVMDPSECTSWNWGFRAIADTYNWANAEIVVVDSNARIYYNASFTSRFINWDSSYYNRRCLAFRNMAYYLGMFDTPDTPLTIVGYPEPTFENVPYYTSAANPDLIDYGYLSGHTNLQTPAMVWEPTAEANRLWLEDNPWEDVIEPPVYNGSYTCYAAFNRHHNFRMDLHWQNASVYHIFSWRFTGNDTYLYSYHNDTLLGILTLNVGYSIYQPTPIIQVLLGIGVLEGVWGMMSEMPLSEKFFDFSPVFIDELDTSINPIWQLYGGFSGDITPYVHINTIGYRLDAPQLYPNTRLYYKPRFQSRLFIDTIKSVDMPIIYPDELKMIVVYPIELNLTNTILSIPYAPIYECLTLTDSRSALAVSQSVCFTQGIPNPNYTLNGEQLWGYGTFNQPLILNVHLTGEGLYPFGVSPNWYYAQWRGTVTYQTQQYQRSPTMFEMLMGMVVPIIMLGIFPMVLRRYHPKATAVGFVVGILLLYFIDWLPLYAMLLMAPMFILGAYFQLKKNGND